MEQTISEMNVNSNSGVDLQEKTSARECCSRCGGLLVGDRCYDLASSGIFKIAMKRCVQCGDVIDPMILKHRALSTYS